MLYNRGGPAPWHGAVAFAVRENLVIRVAVERHACVTCCRGMLWATGSGGGPVAGPPSSGGNGGGGLPGRPSDDAAIIGGVVGGELRQGGASRGAPTGGAGTAQRCCARIRVVPYTCTEVLLPPLPAGVGGALALAGVLALVLWRRKQQRLARDCWANPKVDKSEGR